MQISKAKKLLLIASVTLIASSCTANANDSSQSQQSQTEESTSSFSSEVSSENSSSKESISSIERPIIATIEFGAKTHSESTAPTDSSYHTNNINISNIQYTSCYGSSYSNDYESSNSLKMSSGKKQGSFTVTFAKPYIITSAIVYASKYSSDSDSQYKFSTSANTAGTTVTIDDSNEKQYTFANLDNGVGTASTSLTFGAESKGRIFVHKIQLQINSSSTPSSSSSQTSTSSETSSSTSESSSYVSHVPDIEESGYYQGVDWNATGATLKTSLFNVISKNTKTIGYDGLWNAYKTTDVTSDGYIWDMYSNEKYVPGGSKQGKNYSAEGDAYNREHTIPQSIFSEASPMKCDIFHVVPTDGYVNNKRSNYPHGNVSNASYTSNNGSKLGTGNNNGYSGTVFEVIDEYKGDFARMYFYFVTRYQDKIPNYNYASFAKNTYPSLSSWAIKTYMVWNDKDPVSEKETARNEAAYKLQNNRNPFIDHPEAAHKIWDSCL